MARAALLLAVSSAASLIPTSATAQSISRGMIEGVVRDTADEGFADARVRITGLTSGVEWWLRTDGEGRFRLPFLLPENYEIFVEQIGYQPLRLSSVTVLPGRRQKVSLVLRPAVLPVHQVEEVRDVRPLPETRPDRGVWLGQFELFDLPEGGRALTELGRLSGRSTAGLDSEGLPGSLSGLYIDGLPFAALHHPDLPSGQMIGSAFPLSAFESAELLTNATDVEMSGFAGAYLTGNTRRGTSQPGGVGYADFISGEAVTSDHFEVSELGTANQIRAGAVFTGPIVADTASYAIGLEGQRLQVPRPDAWALDAQDAELIDVADSVGVDLVPYTNPRVATVDVVSGFSRFDWQVTGNHHVSARANGAWFKRGGGDADDPGLAPGRFATLAGDVEGTDFSAGATLTSRISSRFGNELRIGLDRTDREFSPSTLPGTRIVDGGLAFGADPTFPSQFEGLAARFIETLHVFLGAHRVKFGIDLTYRAAEQRYAFGSGGLFTFAGVDELAAAQGVFMIADGPARADFDGLTFAGFIQDWWAAAPGLEVTIGLRYEGESLDNGAVRLNSEWETLTGISNKAFDDDVEKFSPRFGFSWNIAERDDWIIRGSAGLYHDAVSAGLFGEVATLNGPVVVRRGVGDLSGWPALPGTGTAPEEGTLLTVLGPKFEPARSTRASLGVTRLFPDGTQVMVSGTYRFTNRLPRRADLNRPLAPTTTDQYGRPIFGNLIQQGSLLTVEPGSNRRFDDFDLVSAINADGESTYWDATIAVQRHASETFDVLASYTYSWSRDDWLGGSGGGREAELDPFPDGLDGADWRDGRSDFDRPHRVVVGAEAKFPQALAGLRLAALYRFMSGSPFTPGFRAGVDVNGDGSGHNDPAFIDPDIAGIDALIAQWDCIADQLGGFAERNSCRAPDLHLLDLRVALGLVELQGRSVELVFDALNVIDADTGVRDSALLLIDRDGTVETNPDGSLTLPLVANQNFGEALVRDGSGRSFRFGLRVGL